MTSSFVGIVKTNKNDQPNHGGVGSKTRVRISSSTRQPAAPRWKPTPEQLVILEEMYARRGIRTPTAYHIQQIAAYLTLYGKIEEKNVFYWFQNRKARDRQKLQRKIDKEEEMSGAFQEGLSANSTGDEECCKSNIACGSVEQCDRETTTIPPETLELFPLCSGF